MTSLNENMCPDDNFIGRKVDYKQEFMVGYGDYVEAIDQSNHMTKWQTERC